MRERLDCAILGFGGMTDWCKQKAGVYAKGRLHLHRLDQPEPTLEDARALATMAVSLQRFDACLLAVCESNLGWVRQAMLAANGQLRTPVIGLLHNLTAPAIDDLYNLGMADFVREPVCLEEIRIRTERLLNKPRVAVKSAYSDASVAAPCAVYDGSRLYGQADARSDHQVNGRSISLSDDQALRVQPGGSGVQEHGDLELEAFAIASASRCASSSDPFGIAKGKVIGCFERAYLLASLAKSSGNIAMAARGAKKHRRAFWALMRKYEIDAAPFRRGLPPD